MRKPGALLAAILTLSCVADEHPAVTVRHPAPFPTQPAEPPEALASDAADDLPPLAPSRPVAPGAYDLGKLPVFSKVLFYVRENYFDKRRLNYRNMLLGAMDFVQRDVPEVVIFRVGDQITVNVAGHQAGFSLKRIDQPWSLRSKLQQVMQFVQENIRPWPRETEAAHLLEVEMAATNGMLYTLDPHSVLIDAASYAAMRSPRNDDRPAAVGLGLERDASDRLTVISVVLQSPAALAEIAVGDRITRIDGAATEHMTNDAAVEELRGAVGSRVEIVLERTGRRSPQKAILERALIHATPIAPAARLLPDKIGYFRLRRLASGASFEVDQALRALAQQGATGIIMDLRRNPGGLYAEAHKVADEFVDHGTLVSMVGPNASQRKDETATGTAPAQQLPLVVLVDHHTGSGAEVIAAAMKNLDRGVVIGERTFGNGTVQVLYDIPSPLAPGLGDETKLGLKLTTAQLLAAGGAPLQGVGVVPDIRTAALVVPPTGPSSPIRLDPMPHYAGERDYEWALPPAMRPREELAGAELHYLLEREPGPDPNGVRAPDPEVDPLTTLARGFLHQVKGFERHQLLATADQFVARWRADEDAQLSAALTRLGIDWASGPSEPPPALQLTLARSGAPGATMRIRGVARNVGTTPAFRVRAVIDSGDAAFDGVELVFGKIAPGQSKSYETSGLEALPGGPHLSRTVFLHGRLVAADHPLPQSADLRVEVAGPAPSTFSFRYRVQEAAEGSNRDGRIERGEQVEIPVTITNTGPVVLAHLRTVVATQATGQPARVPAGRFEIGQLAPGASKTVTFLAAISPAVGPDYCDLQLELQPESGDTMDHLIRIDLSHATSAGAAGSAGPAAIDIDPPRLTLRGPAVAEGDTVNLEGTATDPRGVRDLFIRVWNRTLKIPVRKVFYQANQPADAPELTFKADVPISPGMNLIQVFARQSTEAASMQTLVVSRPLPTGGASERP
jgi:carboxyl-terminal processing protease